MERENRDWERLRLGRRVERDGAETNAFEDGERDKRGRRKEVGMRLLAIA